MKRFWKLQELLIGKWKYKILLINVEEEHHDNIQSLDN